MATYAIGDIHGALDTLDELLALLKARGPIDALWFVGDLVNRGPDSAGVIRRVRDLGERAITVLGNHDLAVLSIAHSQKQMRETDDAGLKTLFAADDRDELLDWLRHRPLMHHDAALGWTLVHAGIAPEWDLQDAQRHAGELEVALRGPDHAEFLRKMLGNTPARWDDSLTGNARLRYIANALTRIRFVEDDGRLDMKYKKTIEKAPAGLTPWFAVDGRRSAGTRIVFGHWSALDALAWPAHNVYGIDTGAAWSGPLTALQLDTDEPVVIQTSPAT